MNAPFPDDAQTQMRRMTRRAFAVGGLTALAGGSFLAWLQSRSQTDRIPWPLRNSHELNELVGRQLYSPNQLAREYDSSLAAEPRVNGWIGWQEEMPTSDAWKLQIERPGIPARTIALSELANLPRSESTNELKCVEGWSQIVTWSGVRFADFLKAFDLLPEANTPLKYLQLTTTNGEYTVGLDLESALHPQTLICDRMNGAPLTVGHGAPIRLVLPIKYGIKNIKWLSTIRFLEFKPSDYWTARGYDWYAGL